MRTIKSSRDIDSLFRNGRRASNELLTILAGPTPDGRGPEGRVAFIAGKKLGGAVMRNRSKRVMRSAIRRVQPSWAGWDVAVIARSGLADAPPDKVDRRLLDALRKLDMPNA